MAKRLLVDKDTSLPAAKIDPQGGPPVVACWTGTRRCCYRPQSVMIQDKRESQHDILRRHLPLEKKNQRRSRSDQKWAYAWRVRIIDLSLGLPQVTHLKPYIVFISPSDEGIFTATCADHMGKRICRDFNLDVAQTLWVECFDKILSGYFHPPLAIRSRYRLYRRLAFVAGPMSLKLLRNLFRRLDKHIRAPGFKGSSQMLNDSGIGEGLFSLHESSAPPSIPRSLESWPLSFNELSERPKRTCRKRMICG